MDGAPPTATTMTKISEAAFIPRPLTNRRLSKTLHMTCLAKTPVANASGKEIKAKIEDRAWWKERGGKLKLTKPHNPQPEHYIAAVTKEIKHLPRISEITPQPNTKMKQSKGKRWNELVLMMSLPAFVSRKFAEIDEAHKVYAPKMKWSGDVPQIKITLGREKNSCVNDLYNLTEEMMKQSSQLLREDIERLEDKIEWMMLDTKQTLEEWRIEKTINEIEHMTNLETDSGDYNVISECESNAEQLLAELQEAKQTPHNFE